MDTLLLIVHIFVSILLILVVLLQSGKGGGMGATFGGASQQIFGGRGAGGFLARVTTGAAIVFFLTSLTLSMIGSRESSVLDQELENKEKVAAAEEPAAGEVDEGQPEAATGGEGLAEAGVSEPSSEETAPLDDAAAADSNPQPEEDTTGSDSP